MDLYLRSPHVLAVWHLIRNRDDFVFLIWYVVMRKVMRKSQNTNFGTEKQTDHKTGLIVFPNKTRYKTEIT